MCPCVRLHLLLFHYTRTYLPKNTNFLEFISHHPTLLNVPACSENESGTVFKRTQGESRRLMPHGLVSIIPCRRTKINRADGILSRRKTLFFHPDTCSFARSWTRPFSLVSSCQTCLASSQFHSVVNIFSTSPGISFSRVPAAACRSFSEPLLPVLSA